MKEYQIKNEPVSVEGVMRPYYKIYYYSDMALETIEAYYPDTVIREGYKNMDEPMNWRGLVSGLRDSNVFSLAITGQIQINQIAYSTLMKVLTDGENRNSSESFLLTILRAVCVNFSQSQKDEINTILTTNQFTIQL